MVNQVHIFMDICNFMTAHLWSNIFVAKKIIILNFPLAKILSEAIAQSIFWNQQIAYFLLK